MKVLMLRFDAPLMSFGGVMVDQHGPTDRFPGLAMLTGLLGNALGFRHGEFDRLQDLQERLRFAARWDLDPEALCDYHTVDLGQRKMKEPGWTTRGKPEHRDGGPGAKFGTHQRYRHYWANGVMTLAITIEGNAYPGLDDLESALREPARPLFIGRKTCLPAAPLVLGQVDAEHLLAALRTYQPDPRAPESATDFAACWPSGEEGPDHGRMVVRYDQREWNNQIHTGQRKQYEGRIRRGTP